MILRNLFFLSTFLTLSSCVVFSGPVSNERSRSLSDLSVETAAVELDSDSNGGIDIPRGGTNAITAAGARVNLGLEIGVDVQAYDADLSTYAGISPSADVQTLLSQDNEAGIRTFLDLESGTDFYSVSSADSTFEAALGNPVTNGYVLSSQTDGTRSWIEMTGGGNANIETDVYGVGWDGDNDNGASQNVIYDYLVQFDSDSDGDFTDETWFATATGAPLGAFYYTTTADGNLTNEIVIPAFMQNVLDDTSEAIFKATVNLEIGTDIQAFDADLTVYAGITPSTNIQTFLGSADFAAARTNLGLAIGTDVQAFDANLPSWPAAVDATETSYLDGVTSAIQTQLNAKQDDLAIPSQAEAEAGTATVERVWTAQRIGQHTTTAINAHAALSDPHTGYMLESNVGTSANNYIQIDTNGNLPFAIGIDTINFGGEFSNTAAFDTIQELFDHLDDNMSKDDAIEFVIDGGGSAITTGIKGDLEIPWGATINRVTLLCDQSTTTVVDIWKDTYTNFPPTDTDSITASAIPGTSASNKDQDTTLTGWTTSITAGDIIRFNVDSNDNATRCTISLKVTKS